MSFLNNLLTMKKWRLMNEITVDLDSKSSVNKTWLQITVSFIPPSDITFITTNNCVLPSRRGYITFQNDSTFPAQGFFFISAEVLLGYTY